MRVNSAIDYLNSGFEYLNNNDSKNACECFTLFMEHRNQDEYDDYDDLYQKLELVSQKTVSNSDYENAINYYSFIIKFYTGFEHEDIEWYAERGNLYFKLKKYDAAIEDYHTAIKILTKTGEFHSGSDDSKSLSNCYQNIRNIYKRLANTNYIKSASALGGTDILGVSREVMPLADKFREENDFESEHEAYETILSSAYEYDEADKDLVDDIRVKMEVTKCKMK
jgi:tetratricopeptide (TPR) repeat protein